MIAGNASSARFWPWPTVRHQLLYTLVPIAAFVCAWWVSAQIASATIWLQVVIYSVLQLALIGLRRIGCLRIAISVGLGLIIDLILSFVLLGEISDIGSAFYALYALIALRALSVYRLTPAATIIPFALGPIYLLTRTVAAPFAQLPAYDQRNTLIMLVGSLTFGIAAIWASTSTVRANTRLQQELREAQRAADLRVSQLEGSANDLRARVREQHALEEGLRVISSSLSLDEVLSQIVDSTVQMLGMGRARSVALSLRTGAAFEHRMSGLDSYLPPKLADALALRMLHQQVPLIIGNMNADDELAAFASASDTALSVPLFVGNAAARGALTVVGTLGCVFDSVDARHLSALATQAGIAIQNAELHSAMLQQRQLLESVVRDITDGLVVFNAQLDVVLANPFGRRLLDGVPGVAPIREKIIALVTTMHADGKQILSHEISTRVAGDDEDVGNVYQAWASLVRQYGSDEPLTAVVLHDITAQKAEERDKQEFISMVAHELRNPLHSMNGFVKLVIGGKVGPLTDLQQEFLGIVDGQIGLLNGRIAELLEYNRYQVGKMAINQHWGDMPLLVAGTVQRLSLQVQNNGLEVHNEVAPNLPECYFDAERVGQVLTNLVENAIKATPPGGVIRVVSELHDTELWMRVCDTGVGISLEEQNKIFQAFYRAHDRTSTKGNHLGLGLAICQQIVEAHRGRIWVESELGKGSCFSFALPLFERERAIGER